MPAVGVGTPPAVRAPAVEPLAWDTEFFGVGACVPLRLDRPLVRHGFHIARVRFLHHRWLDEDPVMST